MSVIDEVKDRLDIVELVSSYISLQKSGRNHKALCPFHSEKTPSFVVFPDSQRWHCFGACGEGGDIFNFVMKQEGWDFRTALEELARQAGVELRPRTPAQIKAEEKVERLRDLLAKAAQYYHHLLLHAPEAEEARDYITQRNLNDETIERFALGYSLPGWDHTRAYLTEQGYTTEELVEAGLLVQREDDSSTYDRFRDRLMIPIRDVRGRVIGFGARTLDPDGVPKYLNSPQTNLFNKSQTLFGLDLARQTIRRKDQAIIVEGYMDVMQAYQAGFTNLVAQMGTALTETQLRQLQRYTEHLVLSLDPDAAGVQATLRGVEVARETLDQEWEPIFDPRGLVGRESRLGMEIRVLRLPPGQDPDDLIREEPQRWADLVEGAVSVVDFYFQILMADLDPEDSKAKASLVDKLLPVLQAVANPVEREDYAQKIARTLRIDARAVLSRLHGDKRQRARQRARPLEHSHFGPARPQDEGSGKTQSQIAQADLEGHCLAALLQRPTLIAHINEALRSSKLDPLNWQDFQVISNRVIFEAWSELVREEHPAPTEALRTQLPSDLHAHLEKLLTSDKIEVAEEQLVRDVLLTLLRLRKRNLKRLGQELSFLTLESREAGDMRAEQYIGALRTYKEALLRTQQALARSW